MLRAASDGRLVIWVATINSIASISILDAMLDTMQQARKVEYLLTRYSKYLVLLWLCKGALNSWRHLRARGLIGTGNELVDVVRKRVIALLFLLPSTSAKLNAELATATAGMRAKLAPTSYPASTGLEPLFKLPAKGQSVDWIEKQIGALKGLEKGDVQEGRVSGAVYHGGEDLNKVIQTAMSAFVVSNPLHPDVFPGVRKMEAEVVRMCLDLFHGQDGAGTTTSGGTESILMACKTYRDWARKTKGITKPEMIIPASAHAAFYKASDYFGIKLHVIAVDVQSRKADVKAMRRAINPNTIMLVGSAPNFPDGAIDPIPELAKLAKRYNLGLHVDCCLGSFIMPFLHRAGLGEGVEPFDFAVDGVTSISCDTHKYAFCPKGSSVIMYHSPALRRFQYYVQTDWTGGVYASPSMAGSRPGAILAGAWAVMNHLGEDGYTESCKTIVGASRHLAASIRERFPEDLYILGDPKVSVVAFASRKVNIYAVGDLMGKRGWHLNALAKPAALHLACTMLTAKSIDKLVDDLAEVIEIVKGDPNGLNADKGDMVALYGVGQTSVGPIVVSKLAEAFLDTLYA